MTELLLHGRLVRTLFDLLGAKEDDITYSLGWALSQSDDLVYALLTSSSTRRSGSCSAFACRRPPRRGRTDIEIEAEDAHLIIEAKRGWEVETRAKLATYATRFEK